VAGVAREEHEQPEGGQHDPVRLDAPLLFWCQLEPGDHSLGIEQTAQPGRRVLDQVGDLEGEVTHPGVLEVDQTHPVAVPEHVGDVPVALGDHPVADLVDSRWGIGMPLLGCDERPAYDAGVMNVVHLAQPVDHVGDELGGVLEAQRHLRRRGHREQLPVGLGQRGGLCRGEHRVQGFTRDS